MSRIGIPGLAYVPTPAPMVLSAEGSLPLSRPHNLQPIPLPSSSHWSLINPGDGLRAKGGGMSQEASLTLPAVESRG